MRHASVYLLAFVLAGTLWPPAATAQGTRLLRSDTLAARLEALGSEVTDEDTARHALEDARRAVAEATDRWTAAAETMEDLG